MKAKEMNLDIFLSVVDLWRLIGYSCYNSAQRAHKEIRHRLGKEKAKKLTIKEYCEYEKIDYDYVFKYLRGVPPPIAFIKKQ